MSVIIGKCNNCQKDQKWKCRSHVWNRAFIQTFYPSVKHAVGQTGWHPRYYVASCSVNFEWLRSYRQLCSGLPWSQTCSELHSSSYTMRRTAEESRGCSRRTPPLARLWRAAQQKTCKEINDERRGPRLKEERRGSLLRSELQPWRARWYSSPRKKKWWRKWATRYLQWRGCCGGT